MPEFDLESCFEKASDLLKAQTQAHEEAWHIGEAERWAADVETGYLSWIFADRPTVRSPYQFDGSWNEEDDTFLWGWDHPLVEKRYAKDAETVLAFAEEHDLEILQQRHFHCPEWMAWNLTALTTMICNRHGAYRGSRGTSLFMTFGEIEILSQ